MNRNLSRKTSTAFAGIALIFLTILITMASRHWWFVKSYDVIVPFQHTFYEIDELTADDHVIAALDKLNTATTTSSHTTDAAREYSPYNSRILKNYIQKAIAKPAVYFSPHWEATSIGLAAELIRMEFQQNRINETAKLCMQLRWSAPRINEIAELCKHILDQSRGKDYQVITEQVVRVIHIHNANHEMARQAERYLHNPYDPETLYDLAWSLAISGSKEAAEKLLSELLQFDTVAAADLESRMMEFNPWPHPGFQFNKP